MDLQLAGYATPVDTTGRQAGSQTGRKADKKALDKHCDTLLSKLMKIFHNSDRRRERGEREESESEERAGRKRDSGEQRIKHAAGVRNKKVTNKHHMPAKMSTMQRNTHTERERGEREAARSLTHTHTQLIRAMTRGPAWQEFSMAA